MLMHYPLCKLKQIIENSFCALNGVAYDAESIQKCETMGKHGKLIKRIPGSRFTKIGFENAC